MDIRRSPASMDRRSTLPNQFLVFSKGKMIPGNTVRRTNLGMKKPSRKTSPYSTQDPCFGPALEVQDKLHR